VHNAICAEDDILNRRGIGEAKASNVRGRDCFPRAGGCARAGLNERFEFSRASVQKDGEWQIVREIWTNDPSAGSTPN
jgi:hypothetical protein